MNEEYNKSFWNFLSKRTNGKNWMKCIVRTERFMIWKMLICQMCTWRQLCLRLKIKLSCHCHGFGAFKVHESLLYLIEKGMKNTSKTWIITHIITTYFGSCQIKRKWPKQISIKNQHAKMPARRLRWIIVWLNKTTAKSVDIKIYG